MHKRKRFFTGIFILLFLLVSYFINFETDIGDNYVVSDTLLGILIFHNVFILGFYLLIALLLIITGVKRIRLA